MEKIICQECGVEIEFVDVITIPKNFICPLCGKAIIGQENNKITKLNNKTLSWKERIKNMNRKVAEVFE